MWKYSRLIISGVLLILAFGHVYGAERDLRFVMSDLYFKTSSGPAAVDEVDLSVDMEMDELWISYIHEQENGVQRAREQLERAKARGDFKVFFGLGAATNSSNLENLYIAPYIDLSAKYSPKSVPNGDFFHSTTGQDDPNLDIRTVQAGRDQKGFLISGPYWKTGVSVGHEPSSSGANIPKTYRIRVPLRVAENISLLSGDTRIATIAVGTEDQTMPDPNALELPTERHILAKDFDSFGEWTNFDIFLSPVPPGVINHVQSLNIFWEGNADLSVGVIHHEHWDPDNDRSMLDSLDQGILLDGPKLKYGRNIIDYLDDLHDEIETFDPELFHYLGGFWMIDEPKAPSQAAWRKVADIVEEYFSAKPGFRGKRIYSNYNAPVLERENRFFDLFDIEKFMKFGAPIFSFDDYLLHALSVRGDDHFGGPYQAEINHHLNKWKKAANTCRSHNVPCQNFIDLGLLFRNSNNQLNAAELSLQAYLSLALGYDRLAFWQVDDALDGTQTSLSLRGIELRDLILELRKVKPIYDHLKFIDSYGSHELANHTITDIQDVNGKHSDDLRIQVGEFTLANDLYFWLVNRHTRDTDNLELSVTIDPSGRDYDIVDVATGEILGQLGQNTSSFDLKVNPGQGRLIQLTTQGHSLVGDKDNFHSGDSADIPPQSQCIQDMLLDIAENIPGQSEGVDLDTGDTNRPVGLTHFFTLPDEAKITSAKIAFRVRSDNNLFKNDGVFYDCSSLPSQNDTPVIALRHLLGREPIAREDHVLEINLAKVPVLLTPLTGPGNSLPEKPFERRSLLSLLDGQFDMVFSDDSEVDFSELKLTYVLPSAPLGDLTGDNEVDRNDLVILRDALHTDAYSDEDPRDIDGDGKITVLDMRKLVLACTRPRCATK